MSVSQRLRDLLNHRQVKFLVITHSPAFTAQEIAQSMHVPGREMAKSVVVHHGGRLALAVVPAQARVDLERLGGQLGGPVRIASESEFAAAFPDCELGAMPPFGHLYGLLTYVDEQLTHDREIAFNAGTHTEAIRMSFEDYKRIAEPFVMRVAEPEPAGR